MIQTIRQQETASLVNFIDSECSAIGSLFATGSLVTGHGSGKTEYDRIAFSSVTAAFDIEMNMGEYLAEALEPVLETVSEIKDEPFFSPGTRYRCIKAVKGCFTVGNIYDQSTEATRWHGYLRNDKGEMHCWPQIDEIAHSSELFNMKPEDADPRLFFEPVAA